MNLHSDMSGVDRDRILRSIENDGFAELSEIDLCNAIDTSAKVPQDLSLTPVKQRLKHLSATIEPCHCGDADEYQVEVYELDVPGRLTSKFVDVTFHLTREAADDAALKINGIPVRHKKPDAPCAVEFAGNDTKPETIEGDDMTPRKYKGPIDIPSVQAVLKRIAKRGPKNPLKASDLEGQYQNRVARRLASARLVASEKREGIGLVFFGKQETVKA